MFQIQSLIILKTTTSTTLTHHHLGWRSPNTQAHLTAHLTVQITTTSHAHFSRPHGAQQTTTRSPKFTKERPYGDGKRGTINSRERLFDDLKPVATTTTGVNDQGPRPYDLKENNIIKNILLTFTKRPHGDNLCKDRKFPQKKSSHLTANDLIIRNWDKLQHFWRT